MWSAELDARLRQEAQAWLAARTNDGRDALMSEQIQEFLFDGRPFRLMDPQRGIRKPKQLGSALSIRTVWRDDKTRRPYDDAVGADGLIRYKWRGTDPDHADNRALRAAMAAGLPLIWFFGVGTALYLPVFPIHLVAEEQGLKQFVLATDGVQALPGILHASPVEETLRRYIARETQQRLHQPVFRSMVMRAYNTRCAVCALGHSPLLDAAHIVADREELGIAAVRNGLALCKIHHAAYDAGILGITPTLRIEIRSDILEEIDGPLLEHGLKGLHHRDLSVLPRSRRDRPDPELLEIQYARFRSASVA